MLLPENINELAVINSVLLCGRLIEIKDCVSTGTDNTGKLLTIKLVGNRVVQRRFSGSYVLEESSVEVAVSEETIGDIELDLGNDYLIKGSFYPKYLVQEDVDNGSNLENFKFSRYSALEVCILASSIKNITNPDGKEIEHFGTFMLKGTIGMHKKHTFSYKHESMYSGYPAFPFTVDFVYSRDLKPIPQIISNEELIKNYKWCDSPEGASPAWASMLNLISNDKHKLVSEVSLCFEALHYKTEAMVWGKRLRHNGIKAFLIGDIQVRKNTPDNDLAFRFFDCGDLKVNPNDIYVRGPNMGRVHSIFTEDIIQKILEEGEKEVLGEI